MEPLYALALGYLLGSIPFGLILTNLFGEGNLRSIGSGNIGATNVLRTGNKGLAAATLLLDGAKGFAAVALATWLPGSEYTSWMSAGLAALIGHCFPIWLKFRGGKGVATMLGVSFAFDWRIGLAAVLAWLVTAGLTRISSLAGMASAVAAPLAAFLLYLQLREFFFTIVEAFILANFGLALTAMAIVVVWQHRANISRLLAGTEPRIGSKG